MKVRAAAYIVPTTAVWLGNILGALFLMALPKPCCGDVQA